MKFISIALAGAALSLGACATTPPATLAKSTLTAQTEPVDGSAIAFQADALSCGSSSFTVTPRLSDGKYGTGERITFTTSIFKGGSKKLNQKSFKDKKELLHVKTMAPGDYVVTRPACTNGNTYYYTPPGTIDIYGEFTVDAGKTNYLGLMQVGKGFSSAPVFRAIDKSADAKPIFDEDFASRVGAWQVKLAKTVNPGGENLDKLMKLLEELRAKREAAEAAEAAKEATQ